MFCSTIIPTVGRNTLTRSVESVLKQEFTAAPHELIVVNDSGQPLSWESWHKDERVTIINTQRHERSFARNSGAAVAHGHYLHFLDDDDWLAPDALQNFWELAQQSSAAWLYGRSQLVTATSEPIIQLHHGLQGNCFLNTMAGEWIPLQASLIRTDAFFVVGGFNPLVAGPEDIDLLRRITLTEDVAEVQTVVAYIIRGHAWSTTDYEGHAEQSRWVREKILALPHAFERMQATADNAYWHGRIGRLYLTSLVWNLRRRRPLTAASRGWQTLRACLHAGRYLFAPPFWQSLAHAYDSDTFQRGFAAVGQTPS